MRGHSLIDAGRRRHARPAGRSWATDWEAAEPLEGPARLAEVLYEIGIILAVILGLAVCANLLFGKVLPG